MSNTKTVMGQASNQYVTPLDITDVFSTYLYTGTGSAQTITNDIDLDGEGGLTWFKSRPQGNHNLIDTERGNTKYLRSNTADAEGTNTNYLTSFNSNGFTLGTSGTLNGTQDYASWTFRKAPKFFDVVTYTGTGSARSIAHDLNADVGMLIVKATSGTTAWRIWTNSFSGTERLQFDTSDKATTGTSWDGKTPTSTEFYLGADTNTNNSGTEYVAYLFAHNDGDGEFGPNGDADIIKCGSFTAGANVDVDVGFEPQWVLVRNASGGHWIVVDAMRGFLALPGDSPYSRGLRTNDNTAERNSQIQVTSTGFATNANAEMGFSGTCIYIAIRRGTKAPESATEVFALQQDDAGDGNAPAFRSDFPVDAAFSKNAAAVSVNFFGSRLQGANYLRTSETNAEAANADFQWDYMNGWNSEPAQGSSVISYMWKRAPGYFDVIAYTGNGSPNNGYRDVNHNLGVQPEMMWLKRRDSTSEWTVNHKDAGAGYLNLTNSFNAYPRNSFSHNDAFTATTFSAKAQDEWNFNVSGATYIAYLFASLPGISKVGSFSHTTGSTTDVDCGFSSGARFVLFKRTSATGVWFMFDTERGIVSGNDPYLRLDDTSAEINLYDLIDPLSSGFTVGTPVGTGDYIFYAIA